MGLYVSVTFAKYRYSCNILDRYNRDHVVNEISKFIFQKNCQRSSTFMSNCVF